MWTPPPPGVRRLRRSDGGAAGEAEDRRRTEDASSADLSLIVFGHDVHLLTRTPEMSDWELASERRRAAELTNIPEHCGPQRPTDPTSSRQAQNRGIQCVHD